MLATLAAAARPCASLTSCLDLGEQARFSRVAKVGRAIIAQSSTWGPFVAVLHTHPEADLSRRKEIALEQDAVIDTRNAIVRLVPQPILAALGGAEELRALPPRRSINWDPSGQYADLDLSEFPKISWSYQVKKVKPFDTPKFLFISEIIISFHYSVRATRQAGFGALVFSSNNPPRVQGYIVLNGEPVQTNIFRHAEAHRLSHAEAISKLRAGTHTAFAWEAPLAGAKLTSAT